MSKYLKIILWLVAAWFAGVFLYNLFTVNQVDREAIFITIAAAGLLILDKYKSVKQSGNKQENGD